MKVNMSSKFVISAPKVEISSGYSEAKKRFDQILSEKLGIYPASYGGMDSLRMYDSNRIRPLSTSSQDVFNDVRVKSNATAASIDEKLTGTPMAGLGAEFVKAEEKYGVNAWFLTGLAIHESGYGTSAIAKDKNNLFGYQAYDNTPYESARVFSTVGEGIDRVAENLASAYLSEDGTYFNGYGLEDINKRYATDKNWASAVKAHMQRLMGE